MTKPSRGFRLFKNTSPFYILLGLPILQMFVSAAAFISASALGSDYHLYGTDGYSLTQISGSTSTQVSTPTHLELGIEKVNTPKLTQSFFAQGAYSLEASRLSSIAIGTGVQWYLSQVARGFVQGDGTREWTELEPVTYGVGLSAEVGRQLLRDFPSLGSLEATSEYLGLSLAGLCLLNSSVHWAPMLKLSGSYLIGFGTFPFNAIQVKLAVGVSLPID
jgi:hypothetical protein